MGGVQLLFRPISFLLICSVCVNSQVVISRAEKSRALSLIDLLTADKGLSLNLQEVEMITRIVEEGSQKTHIKNHLIFEPESSGQKAGQFHQSQDVIQALNSSCPGLSHTVHTLDAGQGKSFLVVLCEDAESTVTVTFSRQDVPNSDKDTHFDQHEEIQIKLSPNEAKTLMLQDGVLGVVSLVSDQPIRVVVGATSASGTAADKDGGAMSERKLAPILPHSMLGRTHVVLLPQGSMSSRIKVTSTEEDTVVGIWYTTGTYLEVKLARKAQIWSTEQTCDLVIQSNRPVAVVQTLDQENVRIPVQASVLPSTHWRNFYQIQAQGSESSPSSEQQTVSIVIRSKHISGLIGTSGDGMEDVTSGLKWSQIGNTQFSRSIVTLSEGTMAQFRHFDPDVTFQVGLPVFKILDRRTRSPIARSTPTYMPLQCGTISAAAQAIDSQSVEDSEETRREADTEKSLERRKRSILNQGTTVDYDPSSTIDMISWLTNISGHLNFLVITAPPPANDSSTSLWGSSTWSSTWSSTFSSTASANLQASSGNTTAEPAAAESDSDTETALIAGAGAGAVAAVGAGAAVAAVVAVKMSAAGAAVAPGAAYATSAGAGQAAASVAGTGFTAGSSAAGNGASSLAGAGQTVSAFHSGPAVLNGAPPPGTTMVNVGPM